MCGEAHVCQKTLHNFRVKMSEAEEEGILTYSALFDEITGTIIEDQGLKIGKQRLDSTHIRSNMAVLTRLGLFTHTITAFVKKLRKQHPRLFEALPKGIRDRYIDREGYFADSPSSDGRRRLAQCAADVWPSPTDHQPPVSLHPAPTPHPAPSPSTPPGSYTPAQRGVRTRESKFGKSR